MQRQKTMTLNGRKITIITRAKSYCQNTNGFSATVTDSMGNETKIRHINVLRREEAEEYAYNRYLKEHS